MVFKKGEFHHKIDISWQSGEGRIYKRILPPALAKALDLRTKKGQAFALLCERLAMDEGLLAEVKSLDESLLAKANSRKL